MKTMTIALAGPFPSLHDLPTGGVTFVYPGVLVSDIDRRTCPILLSRIKADPNDTCGQFLSSYRALSVA